MAEYEIQLKTLPAQMVASKRMTIPSIDEVPDYLGHAFDEVYNHLQNQKVEAASLCFALWHSPADTYENEDVEAVIPLNQQSDQTSFIKVYTLKEVFVASAVHQGDFDDFTQAHTAILNWIEDNNYEVSGPYREIYIEHAPSGESTTEVQFEVKKA